MRVPESTNLHSKAGAGNTLPYSCSLTDVFMVTKKADKQADCEFSRALSLDQAWPRRCQPGAATFLT